MAIWLYSIEKTEGSFDTTGVVGRVECDGVRLAVQSDVEPSFDLASGFTVLGALPNIPANRPQVPWTIIEWGA